ncbi:MAG: DUF58 domain-containing protein, partial [Candidatus Sericytochromatia bacterium]|nr:DUF58 domain-containing protein [Candidatus Tanganyikabacteria bacterium]
MTPRAWILTLIATATFFAAVNVQAGWLYALADAFFGFLFASLFLAFWAVRKVKVSGLSDATVEQDTPVRVAATLHNYGLAARGMLAVLVPPVGKGRIRLTTLFQILPHNWAVQVVTALPAATTTHLKMTAPSPRRGVYPAPPVFVQASPNGLFFWRKKAVVPGEIIVTPKVIPLEALPWFRPDARGGEEHPMARTVPHGEMIRSTRDYRSGDPLRTIHWRGTAKAGHLVVKETEGTAIAGGATVVLDLSGHTEESLEHAIQVAASLLAHFNREGIAARLVSQYGVVEGALDTQLEALARVEASEDTLAKYLADLDPGGLVVVSARDLGWRSVASWW